MQRLVIATILTGCVVSSALAAATDATDVEGRLKELYPATKISAVRESPVPGVYEVVMGRNVAYSDESGRYMIFGHLYDMQAQRDLTAEVKDELNKIDVAALPIADAIKTVRGNGKRTLYVFSDPDCPYCKRLEAELAKLNDVTIYTFLYPLVGLHPDARRKAEAIWCATDRAKAWQTFMSSGTLPDHTACDNPIERNLRLGESLGINGTPTIVFADGRIAPGALPLAEIERRLTNDAVQRVRAATED